MPLQRPDSPSPGSKRSPSLSPPPGSSSEAEGEKRSADVTTLKQPREQNGNGKGNGSSKHEEGRGKAIPVMDDDDDDDDEGVKNDEKAGVQAGLKMKAAKARHQADLVKHAYEPPKADRPQDEYVFRMAVRLDCAWATPSDNLARIRTDSAAGKLPTSGHSSPSSLSGKRSASSNV